MTTMSQPFIGEIRMFGGNFAPRDWAFCNGQSLPISQNDALFALIGTTYGGDGVNVFNLPNLQSRLPVNNGQGPGLSGYSLGQAGGVEQVTVATSNLPAHSHAVQGDAATGTANSPAGNVWANSTGAKQFSAPAGSNTTMNSGAIGLAPGGGQPHDNMRPFLAVNFIISLFGIFPSRN
jgi:microcystin-dependent protein